MSDKCYLPPSCETNLWVAAEGGSVPSGAVKSGNKPPYYVARVRMDENSLVPGKLTPDSGHLTCWVAWNNTEVRKDQYEVLVTDNCKWVATTSDQPLPAKAVPGGYMNSGPCGSRETLYIGRDMYGTILTPGYASFCKFSGASTFNRLQESAQDFLRDPGFCMNYDYSYSL